MGDNASLHGHSAAAATAERSPGASAAGGIESGKGQLAVGVLIAVCCVAGLATNASLHQIGDDAAHANGAEADSLLVRQRAREAVERFFDRVLPSFEDYIPQAPAMDIKLNCNGTVVDGGDFSVMNLVSNRNKERSLTSDFSSSGGRLKVLRGGYYYVYIKVSAKLKRMDVDVVRISVVANRAKSENEALIDVLVVQPREVIFAAGQKEGVFFAQFVSLATGDEVHVMLRCTKGEYLCPREIIAAASLGLHMVANGSPAFAR